MAAGYDTRAYRLSSPGVTFFEVDLPSASATKQHLVDKLGFCKGGQVGLGGRRCGALPTPARGGGRRG